MKKQKEAKPKCEGQARPCSHGYVYATVQEEMRAEQLAAAQARKGQSNSRY
jgi:hypothetical protein